MAKLIKIFVVLVLVFFCRSFSAQDIGVVAKLAPNSGCQLGSNLTVTVQIFNFGSSISSPFDVSYKVDANAAIAETINLGTFNSSSSYSHTFATDVDLSIPGSYVMKFYTTLSGDVNAANDTLTLTIVNDPFSVGGSLPSDFSVCELANSGSLNLSGYTGDVLDWEITTNGGASWTSLSNTSDTESYTNVSQNSGYRAIVKSGTCPNDTSTVVNISVDQESIGGAVSGPASICTPPNAASISLSGMQGGIVDWEISTDGGNSWVPVGDNSNPLNQTNLPQTTSYRAEVQSGVCPSEYSDTLEVIVVSNLNGGDLSPLLDSVCITSNSGTLDLLNSIGSIDHWESSTDLVAWNTIANTTTTHSFTNLSDTTYFRVIVAGCTTDTSTIAEVIVSNVSVAGTIVSTFDACQGDNVTGITSIGFDGNNFIWETSQDSTTWNAIGAQSNLDVLGIANSQYIRFISSNGACSADTSNTLSINVSNPPSFTSISAPDSLCVTSANDSIVYSGINESILDWVYSEDGGASWTTLSQTDSVLTISPLLNTTYGIVVSSGTCPVDTFFTSVHVSALSQAGYLPMDTTVCSNLDSIEISNVGSVGDLIWFAASNLSGPYSIINSGSSSTQVSTSNFTYVFASVTNGVCPTVYSDTTSIDFFAANYGITGDTLVEQFALATFEAFGGQTYLWDADPTLSDLNSENQTVEVGESTTYYVTITDINSCEYHDSITVNILDEGFQIATIVTPNNDGFNDSWVIKAPEELLPLKVSVSNSFGQVVFSDENYLSNWNCEYQGSRLPTGAYFYTVETAKGESYYGSLKILANE